MYRLKHLIVITLVLAAFLLPNISKKSQAKEVTNIVFSLDFIVLGRHSPWYVALDKGFYKDEGLNVKIIPGKGTASVIKNIEGNVAQFGFVDVPGLVVGRSKGSTIKMLAVNYQALSAILLNGVKDQEARIAKLELIVHLLLNKK